MIFLHYSNQFFFHITSITPDNYFNSMFLYLMPHFVKETHIHNYFFVSEGTILLLGYQVATQVFLNYDSLAMLVIRYGFRQHGNSPILTIVPLDHSDAMQPVCHSFSERCFSHRLLDPWLDLDGCQLFFFEVPPRLKLNQQLLSIQQLNLLLHTMNPKLLLILFSKSPIILTGFKFIQRIL